MAPVANAGHMPSMALRSTRYPAVKAPMAMPTAEPVNRSAKTRRRSAASTHRSTRIVWTGIAAVIPAPKTNMPNRKSTGVPASMSNALATAATSWATTTTRTGSKRSASRPPIGAATRAPMENRLEAAAATSTPQPRVFAA